MRSIFLVFALNLCLYASWLTSLDEAVKLGTQSNRPILVYMYSPTCPACAEYQRLTLNNPKVSAFLQSNFVCVALDATKNAVPAQIKTVPATAIFSPTTGALLANPVEGVVEPYVFLDYLNRFLQYLSNNSK